MYIHIYSKYIRIPSENGRIHPSSPRSRFLCIENLIVCQVDGGVSRKLMQRTHAGIASPLPVDPILPSPREKPASRRFDAFIDFEFFPFFFFFYGGNFSPSSPLFSRSGLHQGLIGFGLFFISFRSITRYRFRRTRRAKFDRKLKISRRGEVNWKVGGMFYAPLEWRKAQGKKEDSLLSR